jgi:hypothetical protein
LAIPRIIVELFIVDTGSAIVAAQPVWRSGTFWSFRKLNPIEHWPEMESRSKQKTGQLFLVFARLEQSKQGVVLIMVREKHNLPQERKDLSPTKHPDGYHQTIDGSGSRRRACRTTIRLFGGREARWDAFHHQCRDLAGLLPRTVMCRPLSIPCKNNFTNRYNSMSSYKQNLCPEIH